MMMMTMTMTMMKMLTTNLEHKNVASKESVLVGDAAHNTSFSLAHLTTTIIIIIIIIMLMTINRSEMMMLKTTSLPSLISS